MLEPLITEQVKSFKYIGSTVNTDNSIEEEIKKKYCPRK